MIDTSLYWVKEFGIDGFRCDVAEAVPSDFWLTWRSALKAQRADLLLLSESEGVQMYKAGFEVAYDWATSPAFIKALLAPNLGRQAISQIAFEQKQYGPAMWRMRYLENHDHDRIAAAMLDPRQREVGAAFLLTIPGLPLIYAGQEIGAKERPSLFDPFTVDFATGDTALRTAYKTLIGVRHSSPALRANTFARVQGMPRSVLMYERSAPEQRVIVLINLDDAPATATPEGVGKGRDLISGDTVDLIPVERGRGARRLWLPDRCARIATRAECRRLIGNQKSAIETRIASRSKSTSNVRAHGNRTLPGTSR